MFDNNEELEMPTPSGHTDAIRASRVIGTTVYNTAGEHIGTIEDVMLEKTTNGIMFAVIGFGGFLGIGEKYHAVPWSLLDYDPDRGGYVVPFSIAQLKAAPAYSIEELTADDGKAARDASYTYWNVKPYWH
jgi:sporulation protein YlmC with PRC-barrel domain